MAQWWNSVVAWSIQHGELAGAGLQALAALAGVIVAAVAIVVSIQAASRGRLRQIEDDRRAAALLMWAEVRTIQCGCREWIQKFSRRRRQDSRYVADDPGTPISVPLSNRIYESQIVRLAHFTPATLEKVVFFYDALEVYRRCMDKPVHPAMAESAEELQAVLHEILELELRAEDLSAAIYREARPGESQPAYVRPRELAMYTNLFEHPEDYLDYGLKEVHGREDHARNVASILARREGTVPPDLRAQQISGTLPTEVKPES